MEDRFIGIKAFVTAIDKGSFTAAAETLGLTGSAIGKSIAKLEHRIGVQLLHRTTRRIDLTTEGEVYLASCRRIIEELDNTEAMLKAGHKKPVGRVRVDLPTTFGRKHILPTLLKLGADNPSLDFAVTFSDQAVDMVAEGIDVTVRIGLLDNYPDLIARKLGEQRLFICAAPSYLERNGIPQHLSDLANHDCMIGWRKARRQGWLIKTETGEMELTDINIRHELTDGDALLQACVQGCGLAQLPNWLAEPAIKAGILIPVLMEYSGGTMPIHVLWQKTWHLQPKVRVTIDALTSLSELEADIFSN
ncbi:LysR family transcriptional regulator [Alteromonadaceae bacterium BrNp21-10]|nr:LysR family transcriptional regulator [Alteromonadaceae bacterium BrNp21-10]